VWGLCDLDSDDTRSEMGRLKKMSDEGPSMFDLNVRIEIVCLGHSSRSCEIRYRMQVRDVGYRMRYRMQVPSQNEERHGGSGSATSKIPLGDPARPIDALVRRSADFSKERVFGREKGSIQTQCNDQGTTIETAFGTPETPYSAKLLRLEFETLAASVLNPLRRRAPKGRPA